MVMDKRKIKLTLRVGQSNHPVPPFTPKGFMVHRFILMFVLLFSVQLSVQPVFAQESLKELRRAVRAIKKENMKLRAEINLLKDRLDAVLGSQPESRIFNIPVGKSMAKGPRDARGSLITLVVFSDYQSIYTARAHHVVKQLLKDFPKKVRFVFKHFPLNDIHPFATEAALAVLAAEKQGKGWEFHELLLQNVRRLDSALILVLGQQLGLDLRAFDRDRKGLWALERLSADEKLAGKLGITGVPTFFMQGRKMMTWRFDFLKSKIENLLEK